MNSEQIQLVITGKNLSSPALKAAGAGMKTFADGTVGHFRRMTRMALTWQNAMVGGAVAGIFHKLTQNGDEIDKLGQRVGVTAEQFQVLRHAFELGGSGAAGIETAFRSLTRRIYDLQTGSTEGADALQDLGLTLEQLDGKTTLEQFKLVFASLGQIEDASKRAAIAQEMFGRSGLSLLPVLNSTGGSLDALAEKMRRNGQLLSDEQVKKSAEFRDALTDLNRAIQATLFDILEEQIGDVTAALNNLVESGKLRELGEAGAEYVSKLYRALKQLGDYVIAHRDTLKTLGFTYALYRVLSSLLMGIRAVKLELIAANKEATLFKATMTSLGSTTIIVGIAYITSLMWELHNANKAAREEAARLGVELTTAKEPWWIKAAGIGAGPVAEGYLRNWWRDKTGDLGGMESAPKDISKETSPEETAKRAAALAKRIQDAAAAASGAGGVNGAFVAAANAQAAAKVEAEIRAELDRRRKIADTEAELEEAIIAEREQLAKEAVQQKLDAAAEQAKAEAEGVDMAVRALQSEQQRLRAAAQTEADKTAHALERLLNPDMAKAEDKAERDRATAMERLERDIRRARRNYTRYRNHGMSDEAARNRLSDRSQELLAFDEQRKAEKAAADAAAANAEQLADAQANQVRTHDALTAAMEAAAEKTAEMSSEMQGVVDKIWELQEALGALKDSRPNGPIGAADDSALAAAAGKAGSIAATDPARVKAQRDRDAAIAAIFGIDPATGGAAPLPPGAVPPVATAPVSAAATQAAWIQDIHQIMLNTGEIAKAEGVR